MTDLYGLREKYDEAKSKKDRLKGRADAIKSKLKKFGCRSIKDVDDKKRFI